MAVTVPGTSPDLNDGFVAVLERTGANELLLSLGEVSPTDLAHCERVAQMAMGAVAEVDCSPEAVLRAGLAGMLHDIGKVDPGVQELIALPRPLTEEEKAEVNHRHTSYGALLISAMGIDGEDGALVREAVRAARHHHDSPGELLELPKGTITRMIQVADRFDAMQDGDRPYHCGEPLTANDAAVEIEEELRDAGAWDRATGFTLEWLAAHGGNWHS